jgi:hypothetical protein
MEGAGILRRPTVTLHRTSAKAIRRCAMPTLASPSAALT